jgi:hypothetical protein
VLTIFAGRLSAARLGEVIGYEAAVISAAMSGA